MEPTQDPFRTEQPTQPTPPVQQQTIAPPPVPQVTDYTSMYANAGITPPPPPEKRRKGVPAWISNSPVAAGFWLMIGYVILNGLLHLGTSLIPAGFAHDLVTELLQIAVFTALPILLGAGSAFKGGGKALRKSLLIGLPILIGGIIGVLWDLINTPTGSDILWQSGSSVLLGLLSLIRITVTESAIFIGLIAHSIGKENGRDQEGVWYAALISGVIFGLSYIQGIFYDASAEQMAGQVLCMVILGTVYAAIYYRGMSLWAIILLHFVNSAAQYFTQYFIYGTNSAISIINDYAFVNYIPAVFAAIFTGIILRRKKIREAVENLRGSEEAALLPGEMTRAERKQAKKDRQERRRQQLREQYADTPLAFRLCRIYLFKPLGIVFGVLSTGLVVILGAVMFLNSDTYTAMDEYAETGRTEVDQEKIDELSPRDEEGAKVIDALPHGKADDTWTICLYMVGANLEDMNENDLSYLVRTQIYNQCQEIQENQLNAEIDKINAFADELSENGIDLPAYLYEPRHPVGYTDLLVDEEVVAEMKGNASRDLDEIMSETWNSQISVVIQTGGATHWSKEEINPNRTQRFLYKDGKFEQVADMPLQDSCAVDTLTDFLDFCNTEYRSDHNMLILWDHGAGVFGYGGDSIFNTSMSLADLREALSNVYKPDPKKPAFDIIGFDACLMAAVDVVHYLDGYAAYMAVSEETEPGFGWDYGPWLQALSDDPSISPAKLAQTIADSYMDYYMRLAVNNTTLFSDPAPMSLTFSVIDVNQGKGLYDAYCALTKKQLSDAAHDISVLSEIGRCGQRSPKFCGSASSVCNLIDLGTYIDYMVDTYPNECSRIKEALGKTVLYHRESGSLCNSQGLAIYLPCAIDSYSGLSYLLDYVYDVCEDDSTKALYYYKMAGCLNKEMRKHVKTVSDQVPQVIDTTVFHDFERAEPTIDEDGFSVAIDPKIQSMMVGYYSHAQIYDTEHSLLIDLGYDENAYLDGEGALYCDFDGSWICLDGVPLATEVISTSISMVEYRSKVMLDGYPTYLLFCYDRDSEEFTITGAARIPDDEEEINFLTDTKSMEELSPGSKIIPIYQTRNADTRYLEEKQGKKISYRSNSSISCNPLGNGYYYSTAVITDQRGDRYSSEIVGCTVSQGRVTERTVNPDFSAKESEDEE